MIGFTPLAPRVVLPQRQRLLDGMARCLELQGYEATTIADVAAAARVSKRTYYEYFSVKQDCLLALYRRGADECMESMRAAVDATPAHGDRVEAALRAMFEHFARHAARSKAVLLGIMSLGEQGLDVRKQGQRELIVILAEHAGMSTDDLPPRVMEGLMGIVSEWTWGAFAAGTEDELPGQAAQAALMMRAGLEAAKAQRRALASAADPVRDT